MPDTPSIGLPPGAGPEYIAEMQAKAKGEATPTETLIAGKFKTQEDLVAAYKALESKLGKPSDSILPSDQNQPTEAQPEDTPPADPEKQDGDPQTGEHPKTVVDLVAKTGKTMEQLNEEFTTNGKLSDETYAAFEKIGIPSEAIDQYIEGRQLAGERWVGQIYSEAGGEQQFSTMVEWGKQNFSDDEKRAFDEVVVHGTDMAKIKLAIAGLKSRYEAANGRFLKEPNLVQGEANTGGLTTYASREEFHADMRDPRWNKDPAYNEAVMRKLHRSMKKPGWR